MTYEPPVPHNFSKLRKLEEDLKARKRTAKLAAHALASAWDDDENEQRCDDLRKAVALANGRVDAAYTRWREEWRRVGKPLDY